MGQPGYLENHTHGCDAECRGLAGGRRSGEKCASGWVVGRIRAPGCRSEAISECEQRPTVGADGREERLLPDEKAVYIAYAQLPASMLVLAKLSTLWNLFKQTLVALAFLLPPDSWLGRLRDAILLLFCFTIYAIAPVVSFGGLLLAMGISQAEQSVRLRITCITAFAVLAFYYEVPWARLLVQYFGLE